MEYLREIQGKQAHDPLLFAEKKSNEKKTRQSSPRRVCVSGPIIVGAGPSGLAVAACLKEYGVPSMILERSNCIASLWQLKTYDRLRLHLPKKFCELPLMGFPTDFPTYPTKQQFIGYLESYAKKFDIQPKFNETVYGAEYDNDMGLWRVNTRTTTHCIKGEGDEVDGDKEVEWEYVSRWVVVATGENAEAVVPEIEGMSEFGGDVRHTSLYKSGEEFKGKRVLVVGCGNSGMEVCLDLCHHGAMPSIAVRNAVSLLNYPSPLLSLLLFCSFFSFVVLDLMCVSKHLFLNFHIVFYSQSSQVCIFNNGFLLL